MHVNILWGGDEDHVDVVQVSLLYMVTLHFAVAYAAQQ